MSPVATTNRLHQAVRHWPGSIRNDHSEPMFAEQTAWLLLFDQLLCAWIQELGGREAAGATTFEHQLDALMGVENPDGQIRQIAQLARQHGSWLYEFVQQRRQLLSDRKPAAPDRSQMIAVQSVLDEPAGSQYQQWLTEFEQLLDVTRELNQEF